MLWFEETWASPFSSPGPPQPGAQPSLQLKVAQEGWFDPFPLPFVFSYLSLLWKNKAEKDFMRLRALKATFFCPSGKERNPRAGTWELTSRLGTALGADDSHPVADED